MVCGLVVTVALMLSSTVAEVWPEAEGSTAKLTTPSSPKEIIAKRAEVVLPQAASADCRLHASSGYDAAVMAEKLLSNFSDA